jgi:peptide/nickel transport system substrate-binding protein
MFQEDMAAIGLRVAVLKVPAHQLYSLTGPLFLRQFELALFAWIASPDPGGAALWSCRAVPTETNNWTGNNFSGWCFRDADRAIRVAATSWNREERLQAYLQQQQLFTQELPVLPLFQRLVVTLMSPGLRGVRPDPTAPITWNIATWSRE